MSDIHPSPGWPRRSLPAWVSAALCLLAFSFLEHRLLGLLHQATAQAHLDVVNGILDGHPYWKAYQNRLLGPWIITGLVHGTGLSPLTAMQVFGFASLCLANAVALRLFASRDTGGSCGPVWAWGFAAIYAGAFLAFQDADWLYPWDYLGLTTMLLFARMVVTGGWPVWQMSALCLVELLNRESAQFIALWMVIDSVRFDRSAAGWRVVRIDWRRLLAGGLLCVVCVWWTGFIRARLCLGETGVLPRANIHEFASGQFYMLPVTRDLILHEAANPNAAALLIFLGALATVLWRAWTPLGQRAWKVGLLIGLLVAANACLAFIYELRVWFTLLPFLPCLAACASASRQGSGGGFDKRA